MGDAGVELDVFGDVILAGQIGAFHFVAESLQTLFVLRGRVARRSRRDLRFQSNAHVKQLQSQLVFVIQAGKSQWVLGQGAMTFDVGTVSPAHLQDAFGGQTLDRLPYGAAPHLKHFAQLELVGQFLPDLHGLFEDIGHQLVFYLCAQKFAFHSSCPRSVVCKV